MPASPARVTSGIAAVPRASVSRPPGEACVANSAPAAAPIANTASSEAHTIPRRRLVAGVRSRSASSPAKGSSAAPTAEQPRAAQQHCHCQSAQPRGNLGGEPVRRRRPWLRRHARRAAGVGGDVARWRSVDRRRTVRCPLRRGAMSIGSTRARRPALPPHRPEQGRPGLWADHAVGRQAVGALEALNGSLRQRTEEAVDRPRSEAECAQAELQPPHRGGAVLGAIAGSAAEQTGGDEGGLQRLALLGTGRVASEARGGGPEQQYDGRQRRDQKHPGH